MTEFTRDVKPPNVSDVSIPSYMELRQIFVVGVYDGQHKRIRYTRAIYNSIQEAMNSARGLETRYKHQYAKDSLLVIRVADGEIIDRKSFLKGGENFKRSSI